MSQMKARHWSTLPFVLSLATAVGCKATSDGFVGPTRLAAVRSAPSDPASRSASITEGTGTFSFDRVHYWACIGEMVHNVFQVSFEWTKVELPNGEYLYREPWHVLGVWGTITGLTSGTVWYREHGISPSIERSMGGGMYEYTGHVRFVSETGPTILVNEVYHLSSDANGKTTVEFYNAECIVSKN